MGTLVNITIIIAMGFLLGVVSVALSADTQNNFSTPAEGYADIALQEVMDSHNYTTPAIWAVPEIGSLRKYLEPEYSDIQNK